MAHPPCCAAALQPASPALLAHPALQGWTFLGRCPPARTIWRQWRRPACRQALALLPPLLSSSRPPPRALAGCADARPGLAAHLQGRLGWGCLRLAPARMASGPRAVCTGASWSSAAVHSPLPLQPTLAGDGHLAGFPGGRGRRCLGPRPCQGSGGRGAGAGAGPQGRRRAPAAGESWARCWGARDAGLQGPFAGYQACETTGSILCPDTIDSRPCTCAHAPASPPAQLALPPCHSCTTPTQRWRSGCLALSRCARCSRWWCSTPRCCCEQANERGHASALCCTAITPAAGPCEVAAVPFGFTGRYCLLFASSCPRVHASESQIAPC